MENSARHDAAHGGLLRSLRGLLATLLATLRTRGELLQVEIEEEQHRLTGIALFALLGVVFLGLAVLFLSVFVILLVGDTNRVVTTGLLGLLYLLIGVVSLLAARRRRQAKTKLFAASLMQLRKDGEHLSPPSDGN